VPCAENKEIADSCKAAGQRGLTWADVQRMKLSWRVVQESMRLMPPVQGSFRIAPHEMSFDGYRIPRSWKVRKEHMIDRSSVHVSRIYKKLHLLRSTM
jgi:hypothetical protein